MLLVRDSLFSSQKASSENAGSSLFVLILGFLKQSRVYMVKEHIRRDCEYCLQCIGNLDV